VQGSVPGPSHHGISRCAFATFTMTKDFLLSCFVSWQVRG